MAKFKRLLRFKDDARDVWYGELDDLKQINEENLMGLDVPIYEGGDPWDPSFVLNGSRRIVREVRDENHVEYVQFPSLALTRTILGIVAFT